MGLTNKWQKATKGFSHRCSFELLIFVLFSLFLDRNHQFSKKCVSKSHLTLALSEKCSSIKGYALRNKGKSKCLR